MLYFLVRSWLYMIQCLCSPYYKSPRFANDNGFLVIHTILNAAVKVVTETLLLRGSSYLVWRFQLVLDKVVL